MGFREDLTEAADDLFDLAGKSAVYTAPTWSATPTAIFRGLTPDDVVSEHVRADCVVCEIRESELQAEPERLDTIARTLPMGTQLLEVVDRKRHESGVWLLYCQQNIRVVP